MSINDVVVARTVKPAWEITIEFEHFETVVGTCDVFYEIQKEIVALMDYREGITEIRILPYVEHADGIPRGFATPYEKSTGLWVARCKCGEEFRAGDEGTANMLRDEHADELN